MDLFSLIIGSSLGIMALPSINTTTDPYSSSAVETLRPDKDPDSIKLFVGQVPKDPDAIKLFVGQVPKIFDENDLKPYLDSYGPIHELSILRDKLDLSHKGI